MEEFAIFPSISFLIAVFATFKVIKFDISLPTKVSVGCLFSAIFISAMVIFAEQLFLLLYYVNFLCIPLTILSLTYLSLSLFPNFLRQQTILRTLIYGLISAALTISTFAFSFLYSMISNPMDPPMK